MEEREQGVWIPMSIWKNNNLTVNEKIVYAHIIHLSQEKGCFAGDQYFADYLQVSKDRAKQIISSLKKKGYLESKIKYDGDSKRIMSRVLKPLYLSVENYTRVGEKITLPSVENYPTLGEEITLPYGNKLPYPRVENYTTLGEKTTEIVKNISKDISKDISKENKAQNAPPSSPKWSLRKELDSFTQDPEVREALEAFMESRKKMRVPNTERAVSLLLKKLQPHAPDIQLAMLNKSIERGWKGLFELKEKDLQELGYQHEQPVSNNPQVDMVRRAMARLQAEEEMESDYG